MHKCIHTCECFSACMRVCVCVNVHVCMCMMCMSVCDLNNTMVVYMFLKHKISNYSKTINKEHATIVQYTSSTKFQLGLKQFFKP